MSWAVSACYVSDASGDGSSDGVSIRWWCWRWTVVVVEV